MSREILPCLRAKSKYSFTGDVITVKEVDRGFEVHATYTAKNIIEIIR